VGSLDDERVERLEGLEQHWERVYRTRRPDEVSWYEVEPAVSLRLVTSVSTGGPVLDVGGGQSSLVDELLARGHTDVCVLDVSSAALDGVRVRLGADAAAVRLVHADVLRWRPDRSYDVWHDRAVFHFLTDASDRELYRERLSAAVREGGHAIVATFATDGPDHCSGLPVSRYDAADLAAEMGSRFVLVHHERYLHRTPAGVVQPFTWVVLRRGAAEPDGPARA
jgi:2-polyprenyl-3-methyl-5-hydroxy-6-metoxy-1,4-benzoquinol methylase